MSNHVHLIIDECEDNISVIMKRINTSYVYYFNRKYRRVGHLFQGRFRSEPIENDRYLLSAVRYIHNNPIEAKITLKLEEYKWSSYRGYINAKDYSNRYFNRNRVLDIISNNEKNSIDELIEFTKKYNCDKFIEYREKYTSNLNICNYNEIRVFIKEYLKTQNIDKDDLKLRNNIKKRKELIVKIKDNYNMSIREIAKELEVSRSMVEKALG